MCVQHNQDVDIPEASQQYLLRHLDHHQWDLPSLAVCCGSPERQAREYIRLAVALGERDPDSIDFYYGPPEWVYDVRKNPPRLDQIRDSAAKLAGELESIPRLRSRRLARQL